MREILNIFILLAKGTFKDLDFVFIRKTFTWLLRAYRNDWHDGSHNESILNEIGKTSEIVTRGCELRGMCNEAVQWEWFQIWLIPFSAVIESVDTNDGREQSQSPFGQHCSYGDTGEEVDTS